MGLHPDMFKIYCLREILIDLLGGMIPSHCQFAPLQSSLPC